MGEFDPERVYPLPELSPQDQAACEESIALFGREMELIPSEDERILARIRARDARVRAMQRDTLRPRSFLEKIDFLNLSELPADTWRQEE